MEQGKERWEPSRRLQLKNWRCAAANAKPLMGQPGELWQDSLARMATAWMEWRGEPLFALWESTAGAVRSIRCVDVRA